MFETSEFLAMKHLLNRTLFMVPLMLLLAVVSNTVTAQDTQWELKRDRDGIQVFTRSVEGSPYKAVRSVSTINGATLTSLVALIEDAQACVDWADRCAEAYLVERISATESLVYTHNDMPFPVKDRDVVARVNWSQNSSTKAVTMVSVAETGGVEEQRGRLRLTKAAATWEFIPQADGSIEIRNEAHIDPGSSLPGWVTNMLLVDTPFETMKAYLNEVTKLKYQSSQLSFIQEP